MQLTIVCPDCAHINTVTSLDSGKSPLCSQCQAELDDPFPVEVTDESCLRHINENDIPVLLDFYSNYCGPCMAMYDDYEDAALGFAMKVRFLKINTDNYQEVAKKYQVAGVPTIIAFKNGEEVNRISQQLTRVELSMWAESLLE